MCNLKNINGNPFLVKNAEDERDIMPSIYYTPSYFYDLRDAARNGSSCILIGPRGCGKSATIIYLFNKLEISGTLPILINSYNGIPLSNNENHFIYHIISEITNKILQDLFENKKLFRKLSSYQKKQLDMFTEWFYDEDTSEVYVKAAKTIKKKRNRNIFVNIYNRLFRDQINNIINGTVHIGVKLIKSHIGIDSFEYNEVAYEYFPAAQKSKIKSISEADFVSMGKGKLVKLLKAVLDISKAIGYKTTVILFDRIDEYGPINANTGKIVEFVKEILLDTDLLLTKDLSIVFSIWSEAKNKLNQAGVRYDKFEDINIEWREKDLVKLIDKRLEFFSVNKNNKVTMRSLIGDDNLIREIINLSGKSPRELIKLLGVFYNLEHGSGEIITFPYQTIANGMIEYCKKHDYISCQKSTGSISQYNPISLANLLLQFKRTTFNTAELESHISKSASQTNKIIELLKDYGYIHEAPFYAGDDIVYNVVEPRLNHLISRGITTIS